MHHPHCSDGFYFANFYFTCSWGNLPFECLGWEKHALNTKIQLQFHKILLTNPHPSSFSISKGWNDRGEHSTSAETDKSAVKWLYWPPHLTYMASLRQSTTARLCPVQGRKHSNKRQREKHGGTKKKNNAAHPDKNLSKSNTTDHTIQPIVTSWYNPVHTHHYHNIHASM